MFSYVFSFNVISRFEDHRVLLATAVKLFEYGEFN